MIQVTDKVPHPVNPFPCARRGKVSGVVVLFTARNTGVVLSSGRSGNLHPMGEHDTEWLSYDDVSWEPITVEITG